MIIGVDGNEANVKDRVGSGTYAYELLSQFQKNKKHKFIVFLKGKPLDDLPTETQNFKYYSFGPRKFWTRIALPLKLMLGQKIDVFFTPTHYGPRFSKVPAAITIFDLSYLHFPSLFKKDDLYQLVNWSKHSILSSKHIFTISESTKTDIVENYKIDPQKITITYPGFDQNKFKPQPKDKIENVKKKYKIKRDYIIFIGTLQPRKNIERLTEAFASLNRTNNHTVNSKLSTDNLSLVIAGKKGWLYDSIFKKVEDLKLEDKVIFTNFVQSEDLPALIAGAKVYVLPSLWEGFGIPVAEAQACGVPVVVSNTSSLPEVITPSNVILTETKDLKNSSHVVRTIKDDALVFGSGILVNPKSIDSIATGIKKVLSDEKLRQDLIKKGFQNVKRFSWETCANKTLEALKKIA